MKNSGFVKIHRKILDNPVVVKDGETFAIWLYLLLNATHKDTDVLFKGRRITMKPGQLITGILSISKKLKVNKDKVQRTLKSFENDKQIEQQTSNRNRLITIVNWVTYQKVDKQNDKQVINKCETDDKQMITNKNIKNVKNDKNINIYIVEIVNHLNEKAETKYKPTTKKTQEKIKARLNEGFTLDDFIVVIDKKCDEWLGTEFEKFLRPETLFGTKFESYLNQSNINAKHKTSRERLREIEENFLKGE